VKLSKSNHPFLLSAVLSTLLFAKPTFASTIDEPAVLVIGASYANGSTPFDDALIAPLSGIGVNFGSYLSVGNALVRARQLAGFVINEGQSGATTFDRPACVFDTCGPHGWHGYMTQFGKALARVTIPDANHPGQVLGYNADHVLISIPNDCLHSEAFGIPQSESEPCDFEQLDDVISRLIEVGRVAISHGITPIFEAYPPWRKLDIGLMRSLFGFTWTIDRSSYEYLRDFYFDRVTYELPEALVVDPWIHFVHIGDGIHPSPATAMRAGREYATAIFEHRMN
jgi:hypothetical protein